MGLLEPAALKAAGLKLTKMQQDFVVALASGTHDLESAAIEAGFAAKNAKRQGYELLSKEHIKLAYTMALHTQLAVAAGGASKTLSDLVIGARSEYVRLQAAQDVLDRLGLRVADKVDHRIGGEVSVRIDLG